VHDHRACHCVLQCDGITSIIEEADMLGSCRLQRRDAKETPLNRGGFALRDSGNSRKCPRAASHEKSRIAHRSLNHVRSHFRSPSCVVQTGLLYATGRLCESSFLSASQSQTSPCSSRWRACHPMSRTPILVSISNVHPSPGQDGPHWQLHPGRCPTSRNPSAAHP